MVTTEAETEPAGGGPGEDGPRSLSEIHPRMPLMLLPDRWDAWLDPARSRRRSFASCSRRRLRGLMRAYPVSTEVSNVRNNRPELLKELTGPEVGTLF